MNDCCKEIELERIRYHKKFCLERQRNIDSKPSKKLVKQNSSQQKIIDLQDKIIGKLERIVLEVIDANKEISEGLVRDLDNALYNLNQEATEVNEELEPLKAKLKGVER